MGVRVALPVGVCVAVCACVRVLEDVGNWDTERVPVGVAAPLRVAVTEGDAEVAWEGVCDSDDEPLEDELAVSEDDAVPLEDELVVWEGLRESDVVGVCERDPDAPCELDLEGVLSCVGDRDEDWDGERVVVGVALAVETCDGEDDLEGVLAALNVCVPERVPVEPCEAVRDCEGVLAELEVADGDSVWA